MNGMDKIRIAKKFDNLTAEKRQLLFDKYGQTKVEEEISRCRVVDELMNNTATLSEFDASKFVDLFVGKDFGIGNDILDDIDVM